MKRVADGPGADGFAIQVRPRPRTTGGLHIPPDRSSTDGRRLDSLMDPVPGFPGADLATLLGTHPLASVRTETVQAILMLDDGNHVPHILVDSDTCRRAAQWLLALEQFRLLYRLLRDRPMDYAMPVSTTQQAHALERMATLGRWPDGASVELHLSTALPPEAMRAMCPFLAWPPLLSLQVAAEGTQDAQAAGLFAQALQGREWAALSIACGPLALDVLQALPGVRARSIAFTVDRPDDAHKLAFEAALFEIVSRCGAHMLNVADPSVDDALAARLVEAQASWGSVHLSIAAPMLALLREERLKIGQVELYLSDAMRNTPLTLSPILLYLLERNGVNTFIAHGMVNLTDFAQSLDTYASHTMGFFDRIGLDERGPLHQRRAGAEPDDGQLERVVGLLHQPVDSVGERDRHALAAAAQRAVAHETHGARACEPGPPRGARGDCIASARRSRHGFEHVRTAHRAGLLGQGPAPDRMAGLGCGLWPAVDEREHVGRQPVERRGATHHAASTARSPRGARPVIGAGPSHAEPRRTAGRGRPHP